MDFSEIALTGPEYRLLKSLYEIDDSRAIVFDASIAPAANRLIRLAFAALYFLPLAKAGRNVSPKSIVITDLGADYYIYLQKKKQEKRRAFRRDLLCVLIGAAATLLLEHLLPLLAAALHRLIE